MKRKGLITLLVLLALLVVTLFAVLMAHVSETTVQALQSQPSALEMAGQCQMNQVSEHYLYNRIRAHAHTFKFWGLISAAIAAMFLNMLQVVYVGEEQPAPEGFGQIKPANPVKRNQRMFTAVCVVFFVSFFAINLSMNKPLETVVEATKDSIKIGACPSELRFSEIYEHSKEDLFNLYSQIGMGVALLSGLLLLSDSFMMDYTRNSMFIAMSLVLWAVSLVMLILSMHRVKKMADGFLGQSLYHTVPMKHFDGDDYNPPTEYTKSRYDIVNKIFHGYPIMSILLMAFTLMSLVFSKETIGNAGASFTRGSRAVMAGFM